MPRGFTSTRVVVAVLLLLGLAASSGAKTKPGNQLILDAPQSGVVDTSLAGDHFISYNLEIDDDTFAVRVALAGSSADLDLYVYDAADELLAYSELNDFNEELWLSRMADPPLPSGTISVEVYYPFSTPPLVDGDYLLEVPFQIVATGIDMTPTTRLEPGDRARGILLPERAMVEVYDVVVPRGVDAIRIDLSETDGDLDLFLEYGRLPESVYDASYSAQSLLSSEVLIVDGGSNPRLRPGTYRLMVVDQVSDDQPVEYEISVTAGAAPPLHVVAFPAIPTPANSLERILLATVEIVTDSGGGSGCIVSEDGYVLTNWHVVRSDDGEPAAEITVGLSLDHSRPTAELYRAEVVEVSRERDLALLRITAGRYGQPLPRGIRFPAHRLTARESFPIGEELQFVGYPWIGGTGSRASITYTRGVVSGYQRTPYGTQIKSDAEINPGNSGGAALDARYDLVGLPTAVVGEDAGQLAYVQPVWAIPASWRHYWE